MIFDSGGVPICYGEHGEGEPLILLHGFILDSRSNWGGFDLHSRNRVIAFDLRGHGESGKPDNAASYGLEMIQDVVRLMDHLKIRRAHVVGYSLGGILALKLLEVAPERLLSLVVGGGEWIRDQGAARKKWIPLAEFLERIPPAETLSSHFWPDEAQRPPKEIREVVDRNDPRALAALSRGMIDVTVSENVLRNNRVPVLAIFGENDTFKPHGTDMQNVAGEFTLRLVPGLDHHTLAGSEEFRTAVRDFISSRPSAVTARESE